MACIQILVMYDFDLEDNLWLKVMKCPHVQDNNCVKYWYPG